MILDNWQQVSPTEWYKKGVGTLEKVNSDWYGSNSVTTGKFCEPKVGPFRSARAAAGVLEEAMRKFTKS